MAEHEIVVSDDDASSTDPLDMTNEDGWEDVEKDEISETYVSLFDDKTFSSVVAMFEYCKTEHDFDVWAIQQQHKLDFFGLVRLVNYVRQQVKVGEKLPVAVSENVFQDDAYLKPVMEDDAVLYSLEEIESNLVDSDMDQTDRLREQLAKLQSRFDTYRDEVSKQLISDLGIDDSNTGPASQAQPRWSKEEIDHDYFKSYSYNGIHETMLKDKVRTDAYRDFIYDNKHLFQGKVVLDVGCGTGILSMFCAKAGAAKVFAIDMSNIIDKARRIINDNGLDETITCIKGKIEEIKLPVDKVDIIVSEWMGYCLLFESMLDSVIFARDKYLAPNGLIVPSHATIRLAPLADSDLRVSYIDFWKDVYGFNMTTMLENAYEETLIRLVHDKELAADSVTVLNLDLHTARVADLEFEGPFKFTTKDVHTNLEGFVLWFDIFFLPSCTKTLPTEMTAAEAQKQAIVAFSTGPLPCESTHWEQGVCLIKEDNVQIRGGIVIQGSLQYRKRSIENHRSLSIDITWEVDHMGVKHQTWLLP